MQELKKGRNIRPAFALPGGFLTGLIYTGIFYVLGKGKEPWTLKPDKTDNEALETKHNSKYKPIDYSKPDGKLTFDLMESLKLSNINYEENQLTNFVFKDESIPVNVNLMEYDGPEEKYCPAGVFEFSGNKENQQETTLKINPERCLHCKACDIKDPTQNINWIAPEGGAGPNYDGM